MVVGELLPKLYAEYRISPDPDRHGIAGWSSGAIAAFTVAWERLDQFRKGFSGIGTYVDLAGGHVYPEKVMASERKPIRIFMIDGRNDNRGLNADGHSCGHVGAVDLISSALSFPHQQAIRPAGSLR